jgi:hypothetical protein
MNIVREPRGPRSAAPCVALPFLLFVLVLAGCSSGPAELAGPANLATGADAAAVLDEPSEVLAPPITQPPLIHSKAPRVRVWTDDWRGVRDQGISLEPSHIHDLVVPAGEAITFHWSARAMTGQGEVTGFRWALDLEDITDETPRLDENDLAHWSVWSLTETSATVGPFAPGGVHHFYVEARDDRGFVSLVTVRLLTDDGAGLVPARP